MDADVIVVGSGASAVHAAWPLAHAGLRVLMLDVGNRDRRYEALVPDLPFAQVRRSDPAQHRYFLGDDFEGVPLQPAGSFAQLTPPREFVIRESAQLTPVASASFTAVESLALGGLAASWGAGALTFSPEDLRGFPLGLEELWPHYEKIAARIGISGARDDLEPVLGELRALQPPLRLDANARTLLDAYQRRRERLQARDFRLGQARLAVLSAPLGSRRPTRYYDLDFWSDAGRSVYRPRWTVEELSLLPNFTLQDRVLVEAFRETGDAVRVTARDLRGEGRIERSARALVLAAGALGTARLTLRSLELQGRRLPLVCNPHAYAALLHWRRLGKADREPRHSLAQLCFAIRDEGAWTVGHVFSYGSLLGFRLAGELPLPLHLGARAVRLLQTGLVMLVIQHADEPTERKWCTLERDGRLAIEYAQSADERARIERVERRALRAFASLGCTSLRRVHPGHGASIHYAGTLPMSADDRELTTTPEGRLRGMRSVWIADGASFPRLPSRGLTFTLMANANRVGERLAQVLG